MNNERLKRPLVLVIFGITGDLAQRKLLPALYQLAKAKELPDDLHIIGVSRREVPKAEVFADLQKFVGESDFDVSLQEYLAEHATMRQMDMVDKNAYVDLLDDLKKIEDTLAPGTSRLYYLSIPAQASLPIIRYLGETGHASPLPGAEDAPRLLVEKPFGYDLKSAQELIEAVDQYFGEGQVYRIDHYVAKETVQNVLTFRFQNPLFESVWNNQHIDHISVVAHESIGIEGRSNFYDQTGALRDLVQSHLLQLLAITTMRKPSAMESNAIHTSKLELMEAIETIAPNQVTNQTVRGQYIGYRKEVANDDSRIETYAKLSLHINNDTWRGIPIIIETGKALAEKLTEISVCFKQDDDRTAIRNQLVFRIQPSEGITLKLQAKQPGISNEMQSVDMDFDYTRSFNQRPAEAYERVIVDAIRGDQTLFASSGEVMASWRIIENVLEQWSHSDNGLQFYEPGSTGPQNS